MSIDRIAATGKAASGRRWLIALAVGAALWGATYADVVEDREKPVVTAVDERQPISYGVISAVGYQAAAATAVTIPTHQQGDLLVIFAWRSGSTGAPALPSGWTSLFTKSGTSSSARVGYKVATGTSDTSGTWTNATELMCSVYRASAGFTALPGQFASSSSSTDSVIFPTLSPMGDSTGNSWVAAFAGVSNLTQTIATAPAGLTNQDSVIGSAHAAASFDTNGPVSSWTSATATDTGTAGHSVSCTVEIVLLPAVPSLLYFAQHIGGGSNNTARGQSGKVYKCPISTAVGAGNTLVIAITYDGGITAPTVVGTINGTFTAGPTALGGTGNLDTRTFYVQNATAGVETITVSFSAAETAYTYVISELYNVATSGGLAGSHTSALSPTLAAGSFTPTNNDATGGNLIWFFASKADQGPNGTSSHFFAGPGFTLLNADSNYASASGLTKCTQYMVQTTAAAVNPSFVSAGESGDNWNCVALAFPVNASAGTPPPAGIQINRVSHFATESFPTSGTFKCQLPTNGNLRLLMCDDPSMNAITVTDSEGNTWTTPTPTNGGSSGFWFLANAQPNPNLVIYVTGGGTDNELSFRYADIIGAANSPFDSCVASNQNVNSLSSFTMSPAPTPSSTNGLLVVNVGVGNGPGLAVTSPSGAIWDLCTYAPLEVDLDEIENADNMCHYHYTASGAITVTLTITSNASNSTSGGAIMFTGAIIDEDAEWPMFVQAA